MRPLSMPTRMTTLALAGLLLLGIALPLVSASPVPVLNPSDPPQSWAYGGQGAFNEQISTNGFVNASYQIHAYLAFSVVLTQTNTTNQTFTLEAVRTVDLSFFAQGCAPSCGQPVREINVSLMGSERDRLFGNFTLGGNVTENGTPVPALAILNAQADLSANLTEASHWTLSRRGPASNGSVALSAQRTAQGSLTFTPALGLVPLNVTPDTSWSSTSQYASQGSDSVACQWSVVLGTHANAGNCSASRQLSSNGTVGLNGEERGATDVVFGDEHARALSLEVEGLQGWRTTDGMLFLPGSEELWDDGTLGPVSAGFASLSTEQVDFGTGLGHLGIIASSLAYEGILPASVPGGAPGSGAQDGVALPGALPVWTVNGTPESVQEAQCVSSGCAQGTSPGPASTGAMGLPLGMLAVAGGLAVAGALVAGVLVARRPPRRGSARTPGPALGASGPWSPQPPASPPTELSR
jgi:hypothetical protein